MQKKKIKKNKQKKKERKIKLLYEYVWQKTKTMTYNIVHEEIYWATQASKTYTYNKKTVNTPSSSAL